MQEHTGAGNKGTEADGPEDGTDEYAKERSALREYYHKRLGALKMAPRKVVDNLQMGYISAHGVLSARISENPATKKVEYLFYFTETQSHRWRLSSSKLSDLLLGWRLELRRGSPREPT